MQERASPSVIDSEQALLLVDPATLAIIHASRGACRAIGCDGGRLVEMSLCDLLVHPAPGEIARFVGTLKAQAGGDVAVAALMRGAGGRTVPVELTLIPLEAGERPLIAAHLRATARYGGASIAPPLDAGDAAFAEFAGRLGHDLNNLLSTIIGGLGLLREDTGDMPASERRQLIDDALSASRECADFMDRLMAAAGKQILRPRRVDVSEVLGRIVPLLRSMLPDTIELEESIESDLPEVQLDPDALEAAIISLVINAKEAMSSGGKIAISSELDRESDPPRIRISVCDDGAGIPENLLARVFEPLFTTKSTGSGRGLGLNIVSGFVQRSNGAINIDSAREWSTRVTLSFPAVD